MQRRPTQTPQLLWRYAPTPRLFAARVVSTACLHPHRKAHQRYYSVYAKVVASTMETWTQLFWDRNHPSPCDKRLFFTSMVLSQSSLVLFSCMNIEAWYILYTKTYMISWMFSLPHITTQESSHDTTPACQRDKTLKTLDLEASCQTSWMLTPNVSPFLLNSSPMDLCSNIFTNTMFHEQRARSSMLRKVSAAASKWDLATSEAASWQRWRSEKKTVLKALIHHKLIRGIKKKTTNKL